MGPLHRDVRVCVDACPSVCLGGCMSVWVYVRARGCLYLSRRLWVGEQLVTQAWVTVVNVSLWTCLWEQDSVHLFAYLSHWV